MALHDSCFGFERGLFSLAKFSQFNKFEPSTVAANSLACRHAFAASVAHAATSFFLPSFFMSGFKCLSILKIKCLSEHVTTPETWCLVH